MDDCGNETPLSFLIHRLKIDERWIIAHLNELTDSDFDLLARATKFHIAHCPRSHTFLGHAPFALKKLSALGFNICLGTDSLASNSSLSLLSEMREFQRKAPEVPPRKILEMATVNGARALGQAESLGIIAPGFSADLIAIPFAQTRADIFDAIVAFEGKIPWMTAAGRPQNLS
jgi:cytosine/adenosine deaminase-related metal-dependent hydrolase